MGRRTLEGSEGNRFVPPLACPGVGRLIFRMTPLLGNDQRYGNSEMVRKWFKLGFISTIKYGEEAGLLPIGVEMQRYPDFPRKAVPSGDPVPAPPPE